MKALEIKISILFYLFFANNTILSCFLIIDLYILISALITQIFSSTAALVKPIRMPNKEPVTTEVKVSVQYNLKSHTLFFAFYLFCYLVILVYLFSEIVSCFIYIFQSKFLTLVFFIHIFSLKYHIFIYYNIYYSFILLIKPGILISQLSHL